VRETQAQFQVMSATWVFISLVDTAERGSLSLRDQETFQTAFSMSPPAGATRPDVDRSLPQPEH